MKRILVVAAGSVAGAVGAAGLIFAAPASAQPAVDFECSPCTIWTDVFANGPWEPFFESTNGDATDGKGAWESGVEAINGGAWEKAWPAE
jgi:hypothetical protein